MADTPPDFMTTWKTVIGVPLCEIVPRLTARFPDEAYVAVPSNKRARPGAKTVSPDYMKSRIRSVFGIGWYGNYDRDGGRKIWDEPRTRKGGEEYIIWCARIDAMRLDYRICGPAGEREWVLGTPLSDYAENESQQGALRGVLSAWLNQAVRLLVGYPEGAAPRTAAPDRDQPSRASQLPPSASKRMTPVEEENLWDFSRSLLFSQPQTLKELGVAHLEDYPGTLAEAKRILQDIANKGLGRQKPPPAPAVETIKWESMKWDGETVQLLTEWAFKEFGWNRARVLKELGVNRFGEWTAGTKVAHDTIQNLAKGMP